MLSNETTNVLRFFALPQSEMLRFLPADAENIYYETSDVGAEIAFSAEAAMCAACKQIHDGSTDAPDEIRELLLEMHCVITMMLDVSERADYLWLLDKSRYPISGPYDDGWLVLKRLATLALQSAGLDLSPPTITFTELIWPIGIKAMVRKTSKAQG